MSLDVSLIIKTQNSKAEVYTANITHNLNKMADKAGCYYELWRPDEIDIKYANQLIAPLTKSLELLTDKPDYFVQFNPENNWGSYDGLVKFIRNYLSACQEFPEAIVEVSR